MSAPYTVGRPQIDINSLTWRELRVWAGERIARLHVKLERADLGPDETQRARGEIVAFRALLALQEPAPERRPDENYA